MLMGDLINVVIPTKEGTLAWEGTGPRAGEGGGEKGDWEDLKKGDV